MVLHDGDGWMVIIITIHLWLFSVSQSLIHAWWCIHQVSDECTDQGINDALLCVSVQVCMPVCKHNYMDDRMSSFAHQYQIKSEDSKLCWASNINSFKMHLFMLIGFKLCWTAGANKQKVRRSNSWKPSQVSVVCEFSVRTICGFLIWPEKLLIKWKHHQFSFYQHQLTLTKIQRWPQRRGPHRGWVFAKLGRTGGRSGRARRVQAWIEAQLWQPGPDCLSRWSMVDFSGTRLIPAELSGPQQRLHLLHRCASF